VAPSASQDHYVVDSQVDVAIERFSGTMEATKGTKSPRQLAEAAIAPLKALEEGLTSKQVRAHLDEDDNERSAVIESLEDIGELQGKCLSQLRGKRTIAAAAQSRK
jgi:hypothetical protein